MKSSYWGVLVHTASVVALVGAGWLGGFVLAQEPPTAQPTSVEKADPEETLDESAASKRLSELFGGKPPKSIADLKRLEGRFRELATKLTPTVVGVQIGRSQGSAVIVDDKGTMLTAAHVIGEANAEALAYMPDGRIVKARTLGLHRTIDAGMMRLEEPGPWPAAEIADNEAIAEGQWCLAMGHPGGYVADRKPVTRIGRVRMKGAASITTDCALVGGDSGGPLFDMDGKLIGINSRIAGQLTENVHVPVKGFRTDWDRLVKAEKWGHFPGQEPWLGVKGERGAETATIGEIVEGAPAEKAGLKQGDVVLKFNDAEVKDFKGLMAMIGQREPGDVVKVSVKRDEQTLELQVTLGTKPFRG